MVSLGKSLKERSLQEPTFDTKTCAKSCLWRCISHRYKWCIVKYGYGFYIELIFSVWFVRETIGERTDMNKPWSGYNVPHDMMRFKKFRQSTRKIPIGWLQPTGSQTNLNDCVNININVNINYKHTVCIYIYTHYIRTCRYTHFNLV